MLKQKISLFYSLANLKNPEFLKQLSELKPDLMVVVAFRMLPREVWSIPSLGTFNLHASLPPPNYRGAAPINWSIINREKYSGVTTFYINEEIDTGAILLQEKVVVEHKIQPVAYMINWLKKEAN